MLCVPVVITRFVDDSQPGWVEFVLTDAAGREWTFLEKVPIITAESLDASSRYPAAGALACDVVWREVSAGGDGLIKIDTERPFGVASLDGCTRFVIPAAMLIHDGEPDS